MKKTVPEPEPFAEWATRTKLVASSLLQEANEMEAKGVPAEIVAKIRRLAAAIPVTVDRLKSTKSASEMLRAYAAEFIELADHMDAAVENETL